MILKKYQAYLENEKCMASESVYDYMVVAKNLAQCFDVFGPLSFSKINNWVAEKKQARNWAIGTVYKEAICVKHFFYFLRRDGYREDNPYEDFDWKKPRLSAPRFITQEQYDALIDDPLHSDQDKFLLWTFWDTGARLSEVAHCEQTNFDLIKKVVTIPYEISKGQYSHRIIPIGDECADLAITHFARLQRAGLRDRIFIGRGKSRLDGTGLRRRIASIGERQSLFRPAMQLCPKMFRHSCCIRWIKQKIPFMIISKWMGHSDPRMTLRHLNFIAEDCRDIYNEYRKAENLDKITQEIIKGKSLTAVIP